MARFTSLIAVLFMLLLWSGALQAQQPQCVCPPPPMAPVPTYQPASAYDREPLFALDLMFGQESGIRGQLALYRDSYEAFVVEGFYGELFHNLGSSDALGAGARWLFRERWPDGYNSVVFGPGVDVFFQLNHNALILLTPSLDVAWTHNLGAGIEFEVGLDAGLGIGVAGRTKNDDPGLGKLTPLISGFVGFRF